MTDDAARAARPPRAATYDRGMHPVVEVVAAVVPSVGVGLLFWLALRAILQADRRERAALAALEAEEDRAAAQAARAASSVRDDDVSPRGVPGA